MKLKRFDTNKIKVGTTDGRHAKRNYTVKGPGSKSVDTTPSRTPAPDDPDYYDSDGKPNKGRKRARSAYEKGDGWFEGFRAFERGKY